MIKQRDSNNSLKEKKYKILSYSILLGNSTDLDRDKEELESTARYLDDLNESSYEEVLASKDFTTTTIEEEKKRLEDIIGVITERIKEREKFNDSYFKVMHTYIESLSPVKDSDSLDYYKNRLKSIDEYIANTEEINLASLELDAKNQELKSKLDNESSSKAINDKMESTLLEEFTKLICDSDYYTKINYTSLDGELIELENDIIEKKNTLDTFISSYEALDKSGISGSERDEYKSYVVDVENDYYASLEKKYMLNIYKLVLGIESEYDIIYGKREKIIKILSDREEARRKLHIKSEDKLEEFNNVVNEQFAIIKSQKNLLEDISRLRLEISKIESKIDILKKRNDRKEIMDILAEFQVPEVVSNDVITMDEVRIVAPDMVIDIHNPDKLNLTKALSTANLVMKKVVLATQPKKFTRKKTAKELQESIKNIEEKKEDTIFKEEEPFKEEKRDGEVKDIVNIPIEVPSQQIFMENSDVKNDDIVFDSMDPFLDDNSTVVSNSNVDNFNDNIVFNDKITDEVDNNNDNETLTSMPKISNIGSVRPTNKLKEIQKMSEENTDIVLPTMGLASNQNSNLSIESGNYLNSTDNN